MLRLLNFILRGAPEVIQQARHAAKACRYLDMAATCHERALATWQIPGESDYWRKRGDRYLQAYWEMTYADSY